MAVNFSLTFAEEQTSVEEGFTYFSIWNKTEALEAIHHLQVHCWYNISICFQLNVKVPRFN